jgi:tetratricopeptide (TPR) repeat protein
LTPFSGFVNSIAILVTFFVKPLFRIVCGAVFLASGLGVAQDKITFKDGRTQQGQITGYANGGVSFNLGSGTVQFPLATIDKIEMKAPAEVAAVQASDGAKAVSVLEPWVTKFKGLNVDWIVDAMAKMAEAYTADSKPDKAEAVYIEMSQLYVNNRYSTKAQAGLARSALSNQKPDEALRLLEPLITAAQRSLTAPATESRFYGEAFLLQGQALEAQGKVPEALESYLTVTTVFYHDEAITKKAGDAAAALRQKNPNLVVN